MAYTTIDDPSAHFQTTLYTGTGSDQNIVNGGNSDLKPDLVWVKDRGATNDFKLTDSSRLGSGGGPTRTLESNTNIAEYDDNDSGSEATKTFNTDGFTIGPNGNYNTNNNTYVAWQWKANGGTTSTNSDGSQNSTVQVNSTAGFSIVKRTGTGSAGATYGHGLGGVPDVIINKGLNQNEWYSYFKKIGGGTHWIDLDGTNAAIDDANMWHDTDATSTVFTVGNSGGSNGSGVEYINYCFKEVQGYSKFGSYKGNGNADGAFVYTGFRVAWVLLRRSDSGNNWHLHDAKRSNQGGGNPADDILYPNENNAEQDEDVDLLSNGFKLRVTGGGHNNSSGTYIYMAFAEHPFVSSEGVPTTAR